MARIRAKDTKPEMQVRRALHAAGFRYRLHASELPGKPDIVFKPIRLAINVHGCFWHRHPDPNCRLARLPKSRTDFWETKLLRNRERDVANRAELERLGWSVIEVWECQISDKSLQALLETVRSFLSRARARQGAS